MKKAFILLVHHKPNQVNIFLRQLLKDKDSDIYLHVNKLYESIIPDLIKDERIILSKNRVAIHWGSDEILTATLNMYREILQSGIKYEYVLICSGQDLLVKEGLDEYLVRNIGKVFIDLCTDGSKESINEYDRYVRAKTLYKWPQFYRRRIDFKYNPIRVLRSLRLRAFAKGFPLRKKKIRYEIGKMTFYKDFYWSALPIETVEYVVNYVDENPGYLEIYKGSMQPEEGFISTILMNNGFENKLISGKDVSKSLTFTLPIANHHAPVISMKDISDIEKSGCFFARKFDIDIDKEVVEYYFNRC